MKRRGFLKRFSLLLASVAGTFAGISFLRQFAGKGIAKNRQVNVGMLSDFPVDTYTLVDDHQLFIYRDHESVKAVSAVCTHLGCTVQRTGEGFECPCHGSCYADDGEVISGPAPRGLPWYPVGKAPDGSILIDLDRTVNAGDKYIIA